MNNKPKLANSENRGEEKLLENQQSHFFYLNHYSRQGGGRGRGIGKNYVF